MIYTTNLWDAFSVGHTAVVMHT